MVITEPVARFSEYVEIRNDMVSRELVVNRARAIAVDSAMKKYMEFLSTYKGDISNLRVSTCFTEMKDSETEGRKKFTVSISIYEKQEMN